VEAAGARKEWRCLVHGLEGKEQERGLVWIGWLVNRWKRGVVCLAFGIGHGAEVVEVGGGWSGEGVPGCEVAV
jgi:hypothetical protein